MTPYELVFVEENGQRVFFEALFKGVDQRAQARTHARAMAQIGDFVNAFGAGRVPVISYTGASSWLVSLVATNNENPGVRYVERVYVFENPASPDIARTVTATLLDLVEDIKRLDGEEQVCQRRKLHHLCAVLDPNLNAMFGCAADRKVQETILRRVEERAELAAHDVTVSADSTLAGLTRLLRFFRSRRSVPSVNEI
jgi:hypothetical protein